MRMPNGLVALLAVVLLAGPMAADAMVFNLNRTIGTGSVTGSITTDGTIGALSAANITDWTLVLNEGAANFTLFGPLSGANSQLFVSGSGLSATVTDLVFDFTSNSSLLFQNPFTGAGSNLYCLQGGSDACFDFLGAGEGVAVGPYDYLDPTTYARNSLQGGQVISGTAPVPLPAAAWLLLSGLGGLGFLGRRRKAA